MKNNLIESKFKWLYFAGFFVILALPLITLPPYFFPPDFGKTIIFRSVLAILGLALIFEIFFKKQSLPFAYVKKNAVFWLLTSLAAVFLLSSIFSVDPYFSFFGSPYRGGGVITF